MVTQKVDARLRAVNVGSSAPTALSTPTSSPQAYAHHLDGDRHEPHPDRYPPAGGLRAEHQLPNDAADDASRGVDLFGEVPPARTERKAAASRAEAEPAVGKSKPRKALLVNTIHEAALHSEVDPIKFDRLLIAQERLSAKEARITYDTAFAAMQAELPVIVERGVLPGLNGQPGSTYALWEDINEVIKPILSRYGFGLRFKVGQDHNTIIITAVLSHASGHAEDTTMRLPIDLSGGKNGVQAIGSSTSYGKRYTASALLNLTSRGEDDDGKAALGTARITAEEVAALRRKISEVKGDERRLLAYLGLPSLEEMPPSQLEKARSILETKAGRP